jgi:hypothetical protein
MQDKPTMPMPPPEVVQTCFEEAEQYWKLAGEAHGKAKKAAYEDMARARIDQIRTALH